MSARRDMHCVAFALWRISETLGWNTRRRRLDDSLCKGGEGGMLGMMHACMHEWQVGLACGLSLGAFVGVNVNVCMHMYAAASVSRLGLWIMYRHWQITKFRIQGTVKCKQDHAIVNRAI